MRFASDHVRYVLEGGTKSHEKLHPIAHWWTPP
jgi:hypothetical protein